MVVSGFTSNATLARREERGIGWHYIAPGKQPFLAGAAALLFPIDWPEPFRLVMIEANGVRGAP